MFGHGGMNCPYRCRFVGNAEREWAGIGGKSLSAAVKGQAVTPGVPSDGWELGLSVSCCRQIMLRQVVGICFYGEYIFDTTSLFEAKCAQNYILFCFFRRVFRKKAVFGSLSDAYCRPPCPKCVKMDGFAHCAHCSSASSSILVMLSSPPHPVWVLKRRPSRP